MSLLKLALGYLPRGSLNVTALIVCFAIIVCAIVSLSNGTYGVDERVQAMEARLAAQESIIAELQRQQADNSTPSFTREESHESGSAQPAGTDSSAEQTTDLVLMQQQLEALALRMEARLSQLEIHLKRGGFIPLTREENQVEVQRLEKVLKEARGRSERAEVEVRRLARALNVPEAVANLSPYEAVSNPRYTLYRPYFEARIAAGYAQRLAAAAADAFGSAALKSY